MAFVIQIKLVLRNIGYAFFCKLYLKTFLINRF